MKENESKLREISSAKMGCDKSQSNLCEEETKLSVDKSISKDRDCNDGKPERKGRGIEIVNQARFKPLQKCQPATHFPFYVAKDLPDKFLYSSLFNCLPVEVAAID